MRKTIILLLLTLFGASWASAQDSDIFKRRDALIDSLEERLENTNDGAARVALLYDIFDLSRKSDLADVGERLYEQAVENEDSKTALEALRLLTNAWIDNDSMQERLLKRAELMEPSADQKETVAFIRIARAGTASRTLDGEERALALHNLLQEYGGDYKVDIYRRTEMLSTICAFLKERASGKLLFDYIKELDDLVEHIPHNTDAIRSAFYLNSASGITKALRPELAVAYEKKLLNLMGELEKRHHAAGRRFRNYTTYYYTAYTRMLMNYEALTAEEIEDYHKRIEEIAAINDEVSEDRAAKGVDIAFYHMARGEYAVALPLLRAAAENPHNSRRRFNILHHLVKAAKAVGDDKTLLWAYQEYFPMVEERSVALDADRVLEYQILHDLTTLQATNADLTAEKHLTAINNRNTIIWIVGIGFGVLLLILIATLRSYRRARRNAHRASEANSQLTRERDLLRNAQSELIKARDKATVADRQKTDFINTVSHEITEPVNAILGYTQLIIDSIDDKRREMLDRFVQIIELNSQLLKTLVNDVLDVAELENSQVVLKYKNVAMKVLCHVSADSVSIPLHPGVKLTIAPMTPEEENVSIDADPVRVEQVLINLISNAVKFTEQGSIKVLYGTDAAAGMATFIVEDTGPGIPPGKEEAIFERFEKVGSYGQGIGLGLHICRMVSRLMGGSVVLDKTYIDGARFIFTLPLTPGNIVNDFARVTPK